jgi:H+/Cl- antiporter ClcA
MKQSKWPDFLFTIGVRFVCGIVLGCLACFLFFWKGILRSFSHDNELGPLIIMIVCGLVGGVVAIFTVPHWQTPWYKGIRGGDDDDA